MADYQNRLSDYVDVAERIRQFRAAYPTGSLQPVNPDKPYEIVTIGEKTLIVYAAAAYRTPDDARPGIGVAMEIFPGLTPYSKNSEIMVAETSAWGRAIVAALAGDSKRVASQDEVLARQNPATAPQSAPEPRNSHPSDQVPNPSTDAQHKAIWAISKKLDRMPPSGYKELSKRDAGATIERLQAELEAKLANTEEAF
jgi:hypothetical protein